MEQILNIFRENQTIVAVLSGGSIVIFLLSILFVPWMVCRIPADYFSDSYFQTKKEKSVFIRGITVFVRNLLGGGFFLLGVVLLFIPGQGILTIFLGLILMDFPGKHKLVQRLVGMENVRDSLNWIRRKRQVEPLRFPIT